MLAPLQSPAFAVDEPAAKVEKSGATILPDGTAIELRITKTLSTASSKVGDPVEFEVVHDVKVGDLVVIPRHSTASGVVEAITPKRRVSRPAVLSVNIKTAKAITGSEVVVRGTRTVEGNSRYSSAGPDVLAPFVQLVSKGNEAFVSKGGKFTAYVSGDTSFDSTQVRQNMTSLDEKNAAVLAEVTGGKAEVHIYRHADVSGGKPPIYMDGSELARIQGERYFSLLLVPGTYVFRTEKSEIRLECKAGEEYYLRLERRGSFLTRAYLTLMSGQLGEDEMYPLRQSDAKDIKDSTKLVKSEVRP